MVNRIFSSWEKGHIIILKRSSMLFFLSIFYCDVPAHCAGMPRLKSGGIFSSLPGRGFFLPLQAGAFSPASRAGTFCAPHFFFLVRKKKRAAPGAKKKEHAAALRCLGLLRIDNSLIIARSAIWKCFRMRFRISAAAAQWEKSMLFTLIRCRTIEI